MISYLPGSVGVAVACSSILSASFEGMGCEPVLNLSATPDEAVSKIQLFGGKLMNMSYTTD
jgi:hypothetical protein